MFDVQEIVHHTGLGLHGGPGGVGVNLISLHLPVQQSCRREREREREKERVCVLMHKRDIILLGTLFTDSFNFPQI